MKYITIGILALVLVGGGYYLYTQRSSLFANGTPPATEPQDEKIATTTAATPAPVIKEQEVIGQSVEDRDITAYHCLPKQAGGSGSKELLFLAGIHGGYEWNTALLANQLIAYLKQHPDAVPSGVVVTVIPTLNPDGLAKVTSDSVGFSASDITASQATQVTGRFNANDVDLNRNFDCDWKASGTWQSKTVSGGGEAFSEPESQALKAYVESHSITAAVVWYSSAGGVFSSNCHGGVLPETSTLNDLFANASGYKAYDSFDFYAITGDAVNWLAKQKIPAISVLLTTHSDPEWSKNLKGIEAVLEHYAQ